MYNFSHSDITGAVILDTRREKDNGLYPVRYRVTFNRKQIYFRSGYDLSEKEWSSIESTKKKDLIDNRKYIKAGLQRIEDEVKKLISEGGFSFDTLRKRLSRGKTDKLLEAFERKVQILTSEGRIGSAEYYETTSKKIKKFASHDTKFADVSIDWLNRFQQWLLEDEKSYTTIAMFMRAIRAILNEGLKEGIISVNQYPFGEGKYVIPEGTGTKIALTLDQIYKLISAPLITETEYRSRDLWYFSYLCNGLNINDLVKLKYSDIIDDEICWYRTKTIRKAKKKVKINAVLLPEMKLIIKKWGNKDRKPDQYIFPFLYKGVTPIDEKRIVKSTTRLINKKMIKLADSLEIGHVTSSVARHSFGTVLKRSGSNIAYISESMGHANIGTTMIYLKSFEKETRIKNAQELTKFK